MSERVRVVFVCPRCSGDVAIGSTWCRTCVIEREEWVKVDRYTIPATSPQGTTPEEEEGAK